MTTTPNTPDVTAQARETLGALRAALERLVNNTTEADNLVKVMAPDLRTPRARHAAATLRQAMEAQQRQLKPALDVVDYLAGLEFVATERRQADAAEGGQ